MWPRLLWRGRNQEALGRGAATLAVLAALLLLAPVPVLGQSLGGVTVKLVMDKDTTNGKGEFSQNTGWLFLDTKKNATGPFAAYVPFTFTNTGSVPLSNLKATLGGITTASAPVRLGGGAQPQAASQYVGNLAVGETRQLFWYVEYDNVLNATVPVTITVTDGVSMAPIYNAQLRTTATNVTGSGGANQSVIIGPTAMIGQTVWARVTNVFGAYNQHNSFNLQPTGSKGFPAGCFQLIGSKIISSAVPAIPAGAENQIWFTATSGVGGANKNVEVEYYFKYLCSGSDAWLDPFAGQTSGGTFDSNGTFRATAPPNFPPAAQPADSFHVEMTVTPDTVWGGGTFTFRLAIENLSSIGTSIDSIVNPLPAGFAFQALTAESGVTEGNSGSRPVAGATGHLVWVGDAGGYLIPGRATLVLEYTATVGPVPGNYTNTATPYIGMAALPSAGAIATVMPAADLTVELKGPTIAYVGDTLSYTLEVKNLGPNPADSLRSRVTLPPGVNLVSATRDAVEIDGDVHWPALGMLAKDSIQTDSLRVAVDSAGTYLLIGINSAHTYDPETGNDDGTAAESQVELKVSGVGVVVTPDGLEEPQKELPGTGYAHTFSVTSGFDVEETFDLLAAVESEAAAAHLAIDSIGVAGPAAVSGDSSQITLDARATAEVTVWYSVARGAMQTDTLRLTARSVARPHGIDDGFAQIRRSIPVLVLERKVNADAAVRPGVDVIHTIMVGNSGEMAAHEVVVVDDLSRQVEFKLNSADYQPMDPEVTGVNGTTIRFSDDGTSWDYVPVNGGCGASPGYDSCVRSIRWEFQGTLAANTLPSFSQLIFTVRIR